MAKMKKVHDEEIDYDITVEYQRAQCPLKCGDRVRGMISGDSGKMQTFPGEAYVVAVESEVLYGPGLPKHTVYLKTPSAMHQRDPLSTELSDSSSTLSDSGR